MSPAAGYIYVVALSNGAVKVGRAADADRRLNTHKLNARTLGLTVTDSWTSPLHLEWHSNEDALKMAAAGLGGFPESREVFSGIEFDAVLEKARELTFTAPPPKRAEVAEPRPVAAVPAQKVSSLTADIPGGTLALYCAIGQAMRMQEELFGTGWRQQAPKFAEATDLALWLEEVVLEIQAEAA